MSKQKQREVTEDQDEETKSEESETEWVGERVNSYDGSRFVSGHGRYVDDIQRPDMLHAYFVRSQYSHAKVLDVDTSEAEAHPGVELVWTHDDIADKVEEPFGYMLHDEEVLASDRVTYAGQEVAVVVANERDVAQEAADLVDIEYERLDTITKVEDALADDAPLVHPDLDADPENDTDGNVAWSGQVEVGNYEDPLADADVVVEDTFQTNKTTPAPMEPHGCIADYDPATGSVELVSSTQMPHLLSVEISEVLKNFEQRDITCRLPDVGGGFGIKLDPYPFEICSILLSKATQRPVKHVLDRLEEFTAGRGRSPEELDGRLGVTEDGDIVGIDVDLLQNTGAAAAYGVAVAYSSANCGQGPYLIPNQHWRTKVVYTNEMPTTAVRGFGDPQVTFMREQLIEMAAEEIGMDAIELRLKNTPRQEDMPMRSDAGHIWRNADQVTCLKKTREMINWDEHRGGSKTRDGKLRGVGMGTIMKRGGNKSASGGDFDEAVVKMNRNGDVTVLTAIASIGQGTETGINQMVADTLGIPIDRVDAVRGDTDATPEGLGVWADRGTIIGGSAAARAAEDLAETLKAVAAHMLDVDPEDVRLGDGRAYDATDPGTGIEIEELANTAMLGNPETLGPESERPEILQNGISLVGRGKYQSQEVEFVDPDTGRGNVAHSYTLGALAIVVDVDPGTGEIDVVDVAICEDVGNVINPKLVEGQVQGAIVQGLGETLYEEYAYDNNGNLMNGSMIDYHLPTAADVPLVTKIEELENPDPTTSHGQKGVGECPLVPTSAAVANAVYDATGIRFTELPLAPHYVLPALDDAGLREI
ncbi:xanthine dehydrogenase family protein molybdopterin-binding subunit [Halobellus ordinarius]|uniref:xanthine dehydrogenase family protein molybdopterin-binding subunit n=1 Tax=Halobellus ordinarius TaxID=3075120 RepID=UPI0028805B8B|nr:xanthine dehydrogenase family protein molybdopterin-binding subunit [Halobellus sp. ZY16]